MRLSILLPGLALATVAGCATDLTTSPDQTVSGPVATLDVSNRPGDEPGCTFDGSTTTCTTTATHTEASTHNVYSGCVAGPPPFHPGSRVTTYEDTYLVTVTTTTYRHGRAGLVYSTQTSQTRELVGSRPVSSVCS
jgi:hypothetical protein